MNISHIDKPSILPNLLLIVNTQFIQLEYLFALSNINNIVVFVVVLF